MGLIDIASLAKWPAIIAGGLLLLALLRWWVRRGAAKEARQEVANEIQRDTIEDGERRVAVEEDTKKRSPVDIARDIGADGGGELR